MELRNPSSTEAAIYNRGRSGPVCLPAEQATQVSQWVSKLPGPVAQRGSERRQIARPAWVSVTGCGVPLPPGSRRISVRSAVRIIPQVELGDLITAPTTGTRRVRGGGRSTGSGKDGGREPAGYRMPRG